jgi:hypothetical protein
MSIVIALIIVLVVAGLITKFYPKPIQSPLAKGEILIPEPEFLPEPTPEVIVEPLVETKVVIETPKVEVPKMAAKPKKKLQPKKKPTKAKSNA